MRLKVLKSLEQQADTLMYFPDGPKLRNRSKDFPVTLSYSAVEYSVELQLEINHVHFHHICKDDIRGFDFAVEYGHAYPRRRHSNGPMHVFRDLVKSDADIKNHGALK